MTKEWLVLGRFVCVLVSDSIWEWTAHSVPGRSSTLNLLTADLTAMQFSVLAVNSELTSPADCMFQELVSRLRDLCTVPCSEVFMLPSSSTSSFG